MYIIEMKTQFEFYVKNKVLCAPYNLKGKVIRRYSMCPQSDNWINVQEPPITEKELNGNWYDVLIYQRLGNTRRRYNGCICIPELRMTLLQPDFTPY